MSHICVNCGHSPSPRPSFTGREDFFTSAKPFLKTNSPPPEFETDHLRHSLTHAQSLRSETDEKIGRLKVILAELEDERGVLDKCIGEHKSALSPARRLPSELVSEILLFSVFSSQTLDTFDMNNGPWPLGQICSRWRKIALSLTKLWSWVDIEQPYASYAPEILDTYLLRSGNQPLTIFFGCEESAPKWKDVLEKLMAESPRWKSVELQIMPHCLQWLDPVRNRLPALEHLELTSIPGRQGQASPLYAFSTAPLLRSVTAWGVVDLSHNLKLPWSQLTSYRSSELVPDHHKLILKNTPNLTECELQSDKNGERQLFAPSNPPRIELAHLRKITFTGTALPRNVNAPLLTDVTVKCDRSGDDALKRLTSLIQLSGCSLTYLHLAAHITESDRIVPLLSAAPTVTKLCLQFSRSSTFAAALLTRLTATRNPAACILPRLRDLTIDISTRTVMPDLYPHLVQGVQSFDHFLFVDVVESRWRIVEELGLWPVVRLRSVTFKDHEITAPPGSLRSLVVFKGEGLDVTVHPPWLWDEAMGVEPKTVADRFLMRSYRR